MLSHLRRACLLLALLLAAGPTWAASPVGNWVLDRDAWQAAVERMLQAALAQLPAPQRPMLEPAFRQQMEQLQVDLEKSLEGSTELLADGSVVVRDGDGKETEHGQWTMAGDDVEVVYPSAKEVPPFRGPIEGDHLTLRPVMQKPDTTAPWMQMEIPLVRH